INDLNSYNKEEGLALSDDEIEYLEEITKRIGRELTDSEVFGFSQVNSEHCRHKIFNGTFIIDGKEKKNSLFALIKKTSKVNPNKIVSAYKDNVAFIVGPKVEQFAPGRQDTSDYFEVNDINTVISLKAETHNFPTTVEPFNGAATGTGGEIRDRLAGGKASIPLIGTAVYITSYPRLADDRQWEKKTKSRKWLYQTPEEILIKASNGASDFGNKFGQALICGSLLTFEHFTEEKKYGFDKVIMLAGGVGFGRKEDSLKDVPEPGDVVVVLGGDNYRIGMGGGAVSSVATGEFDNTIELNAVQRSNPEMQKRVYNAIRAMAESGVNPIVAIHDHGAGGHLNCLSELVEETGGIFDISKLPIGDPTLSAKEIIGNESQERMGLVIKEKDVDFLKNVAHRERAPMYIPGKITGDKKLKFHYPGEEISPIDLGLDDMFGKAPKTILVDNTIEEKFKNITYDTSKVYEYLKDVLQIEAVACKDWLTNKVDRSVTGKNAKQQCAGEIQLPLNDVGVVSIDYRGKKGVATSIGHAPVPALISPENGSVLAVAEALTNIVWAPLEGGLKAISLSANWMWPAKNKGEDARLYKAVEALSNFSCELGINVPTGKDSLSMTQKYPNGEVVFSPGTVIISTVGEVSDVKKTISPVIKNNEDYTLLYIDFSKDDYSLGGSSFSQIINIQGNTTPTVKDTAYFVKGFNIIQKLVQEEHITAGHDISAGGMITALLEMTFGNKDGGLAIDLDSVPQNDLIKLLFSEQPGVLIQVKNNELVNKLLNENNIRYYNIGKTQQKRVLEINKNAKKYQFDIDEYRDIWFRTSYLFDRKQCGEVLAKERFDNYKKQNLKFNFHNNFKGLAKQFGIDPNRRKSSGIKSAIIREKGVNGDREMAYAMYLAGFDVKDVHMTDLISGRENLEDINFIVFVGGFANSDVLGSATGWAGAFKYNEKARTALEKFYKRDDTLSLGICNGCQLMLKLGLINPGHKEKPTMLHNESAKFESAFINVDILNNNSVMLGSMEGSRLGIWVAHGEGKFSFPYESSKYKVPVKYSYESYPGNPNGSPESIAAICSDDGRHLAMMPHLERAFLPWQWPHYPEGRNMDEVSPWIEAYVNARDWIRERL
ncbi:phosphoribosylformylglycinamidine synthase, partial [Bacteroidota bacterium]